MTLQYAHADADCPGDVVVAEYVGPPGPRSSRIADWRVRVEKDGPLVRPEPGSPARAWCPACGQWIAGTHKLREVRFMDGCAVGKTTELPV